MAEIYPRAAYPWILSFDPGFERPSRIVVISSPAQVYGSDDSLLCRTPLAKTIINYFCFANRFRCTIRTWMVFFYPTNFYLISAATDSEFAIRRSDTTNNAIYHIRGMQRVPGSHTAPRYLRREEQKVVRMLRMNKRQKFTPSSISLKLFYSYAVGK